jgi:hypothetical protein
VRPGCELNPAVYTFVDATVTTTSNCAIITLFPEVTMASPVAKLRTLTAKPATPDYQDEYDRQTSAQADDRSFCLLLTSMLENELDRSIDNWLGELAEDLRKDMYDRDGPMGTFARKITLASALDIIGPVSQENFRLIRNVRNAFAHAKTPTKFDTDEVAAVCAGLTRINIYEPPEPVEQMPELSARDRFATVLHETMLRLARHSGHDPHFVDDTGKERD